MHIECPNYEEVMFIEFPITQVIVNTEECLLTVDEVET